jgi:hypothetical protein
MMEQYQKDEPGIFDGFHETQKEVLEIELRKVRNKLFSIAAVFLVSDLIGLASLNIFTFQILVYIIIVPAIMTGLAFLALKEPLLAMIIAVAIVLALWIYVILLLGAAGAIMGWLAKAIIIYLLIAGFQSAREAQKFKREIRS